MSERVRVLVVDDSALMRKLIPTILARDPHIEVVGTAMDGAFALKKIEELQPDVVTLDLEMPRMDGMETLRLIMRRAPLPGDSCSARIRKKAPTQLSKPWLLAQSISSQSRKTPRRASRRNCAATHRENQSRQARCGWKASCQHSAA